MNDPPLRRDRNFHFVRWADYPAIRRRECVVVSVVADGETTNKRIAPPGHPLPRLAEEEVAALEANAALEFQVNEIQAKLEGGDVVAAAAADANVVVVDWHYSNEDSSAGDGGVVGGDGRERSAEPLRRRPGQDKHWTRPGHLPLPLTKRVAIDDGAAAGGGGDGDDGAAQTAGRGAGGGAAAALRPVKREEPAKLKLLLPVPPPGVDCDN